MSNPLRDPRDRRLPRIAGSCGLVMFGVTGDLARKKLMPAVYDLANRGLLPPAFALTGFARRDWDEQDFAVQAIVSHHCIQCHSARPSHPAFAAAPNGVIFDSLAAVRLRAPQVYEQAVKTELMPLGNQTGMTEEERRVLAAWLAQQMDGSAADGAG